MLVQYKTDCIRQILGVTEIIIQEGNIRFVLTPELYEDIELRDFHLGNENLDIEVFVVRTNGTVQKFCKKGRRGVPVVFKEYDERSYSFGDNLLSKDNIRSIHIKEIHELSTELLESRMQSRRYSGSNRKVAKIISGQDLKEYFSQKSSV